MNVKTTCARFGVGTIARRLTSPKSSRSRFPATIWTIRLRYDDQLSLERFAVQHLDGIHSLLIGVHDHKSVPKRFVRSKVRDYFNGIYRSARFEERT
jgi:hypothetical protein